MSLTSYLDNLRERPVEHRKRFAFISSAAFTAVVFVFWLGSFTGMNGQVGGALATKVSDTASKVGTPAQSLVAGVGDFAGDVWSMIVGPKKVKYAEIQILPAKK